MTPKSCLGFLPSPKLFERLSAVVVGFLFHSDQVISWSESNHLLWCQHWFTAYMGFLSLVVDHFQMPQSRASIPQPIPPCSRLNTGHSGCAWCHRRAQGCPALPHSHFPRNNPHKSSGGCIYWNPCSPCKILSKCFFINHCINYIHPS